MVPDKSPGMRKVEYRGGSLPQCRGTLVWEERVGEVNQGSAHQCSLFTLYLEGSAEQLEDI